MRINKLGNAVSRRRDDEPVVRRQKRHWLRRRELSLTLTTRAKYAVLLNGLERQ